MKICFLAPASSAHIRKWCRFFVSRGHEVHVVSFVNGEIDGVQGHLVQVGTEADAGDLDKLKYLLHAKEVKRIIRGIQPDIVNVHYATSYGTVAALAGLGRYVLSVWGSDIYEFPQKSSLHRKMLQFSLNRAAVLFSTSKAMAEEAGKYTKKPFVITPFGVDTNLFSPDRRDRDGTDRSFWIGTVKSLDLKYGIDDLLRAAAIVREVRPEIPLALRIAGKGPHDQLLYQMAEELGLSECVNWLGFISQEEAAREWASLDVGVVCSNCEESFGVAAVEAQACACPVIISDVPGLKEATSPGVTSMVVPKANPEKLAEAITELYDDPGRRVQMGQAGRQFVIDTYEYNHCFSAIEEEFERLVRR